MTKFRLFCRTSNDIIHSLPGHGATFGNKEPGQIIRVSSKIGFYQSQFIAFDRMFDGQSAFKSLNPEPGGFKIDGIFAERNGLVLNLRRGLSPSISMAGLFVPVKPVPPGMSTRWSS